MSSFSLARLCVSGLIIDKVNMGRNYTTVSRVSASFIGWNKRQGVARQ